MPLGPSSERLAVIGSNARAVKNSHTDHRNLIPFFAFNELDPADRLPFEPKSFWDKPVKWDEDAVLRLARHLNFYMSYYDTGSPLILIHTPR